MYTTIIQKRIINPKYLMENNVYATTQDINRHDVRLTLLSIENVSIIVDLL